MSDEVPGAVGQDADTRMDARLTRAGAIWRATATLEELAGGTDNAVPVVVPGWGRGARRPSRLLALASAAVVAAALVVGGTIALRDLGGSAPVGTGGPIAGTVWTLQGYGSERGSTSSYARFYVGSGGRLVADDSCEVVTARARPSGGTVRITGLNVRYRSCTDSVGETTFTRGLDVLRSDPSYSVDAEQLTIGNGAEAMHLSAAPGALPPTSDVPTFQDTTWRLVSGRDAGGGYPAGRSMPTLRVGTSRLRTGTGRYGLVARFTVAGSRVRVHAVEGGGVVGSTGPGSLARLVQRLYQGDFTQVVTGATLTVTRPGVGVLTYRWVPRDAKATSPDALTGRSWYVEGVAGSPGPFDGAGLRISPDGALTGNDGCRPIRGRAAVQPGSMTITGVATTTGATACTDRESLTDRARASTIDSFLNVDVLWAVRGGRLWIDPAGGSQAYSLVLSHTARTNSGPAPAGFVGRWRVIAVRSAGRAQSTALDRGPTLRLTQHDYRIGPACGGSRSGAVTASEGRVVFSRPVVAKSTEICPIIAAADGPLGRLAGRLLTGRVHWSLDGSGDLVLARGGASVVLRGS